MEPSLVPYISEESIRDKSKASGLAKALVCLQTIWFCFQCITRLAFHLPICLLELNTFAHAICTLFIYTLWWDKPLDIVEPTLLSANDERARPLLALMYMKSEVGFLRKCYPSNASDARIWRRCYGFIELDPNEHASGSQPRGGDHKDTIPETTVNSPEGELSHMAINAPVSREEQVKKETREQNGISDGEIVETEAEQDAFGTVRLGMNQKFESAHFKHCYNVWPLIFERNPSHPIYVRLDKTDLRCFELAREGSQRYQIHLATYDDWQQTVGTNSWVLRKFTARRKSNEPKQVNYLVRRIPNLPKFDRILSDYTQILFLFGFMLSGLFYGGIHLLAWNGPFATRAERILWQISGITIAGPGLYVVGFLAVMSVIALTVLLLYCISQMWSIIPHKALIEKYFDLLVTILKGPLKIIGYVLLGIILIPLTIGLSFFAPLYLFARMYIVVECFISLAHLPDAVFDLPQWSVYVPHIG